MGREPVIVIDAHVLIWAVQDDPRLGSKARQIIDHTTSHSRILVSAITPGEIAMLAEMGRIALGDDVGRWIDRALALPGVQLAPWALPLPSAAFAFPEIFTPIPPTG